MLKEKTIFNIALWVLLPVVVFAQETGSLGKIVVRRVDDKLPDACFFERTCSREVVTGSRLRQKNPNSIADALNYVSGLDLRPRGPFGIQGDLALRGSTFEQTALLVDGVRINDPQTGHHNLDLPLTIFDVEAIEVNKTGISSLYGAGALAGSVNIVSKRPTQQTMGMEAAYGAHALSQEAFSMSLPRDDLSLRISLDHKISNGARPNTDFETKTTSVYLNREQGDEFFDALFGYQEKDFGASSFYSNLFPEEEEHTQTQFIKTGLSKKLTYADLKSSIFWRKHRDKFILSRNKPGPVNYHTTYVYGLNFNLSVPMKSGELLLLLDTGRDEIYSTNLGRHARLYEAVGFGLARDLTDKADVDFMIRLDHYKEYPSQTSFNFGLGYKIIEDILKIRGSCSRSFRIPTFTELYYSDAGNKGNPGLGTEAAENFVLGVDFSSKNIWACSHSPCERKNIFDVSLEGFFRKGHNLIDWTRESTFAVWQATNLGKVDFRGMDFTLKLRPESSFLWFTLRQVSFSYNYTEADKKTTGLFSKYVLDNLKNQFILGIEQVSCGLNFSWQLSYKQRNYGETYFVGDVCISKKVGGKGFILEPFIKVDNFTNTKYSETSGVVQPGRWIKGGLRWEW